MAEKSKSGSMLVQQVAALALLVMVGLALYFYLKGADAKHSSRGKVVQLSSDYCYLLRPPGWSGGLEGDVFILNNPKRDFVILFSNLASRAFYFAPLNKDKAAIKELLGNFAQGVGIKLRNLDLPSVDTVEFNFAFPALRVLVKTDDYHGRALIFYSHNVRFLYLALWRNGTPYNEHIAGSFMSYVTLKPPFDEPVYKRPVINSANNKNTVELVKEAGIHADMARYLWANAKDPGNVLRAIESLQQAMRLLAESGVGATFAKKYEDIIKIYKQCRAFRKAKIDRMKSEIIQLSAMGDKKAAAEIAKELMGVASLDSEAKIRMWAKKQYHLLSPPR